MGEVRAPFLNLRILSLLLRRRRSIIGEDICYELEGLQTYVIPGYPSTIDFYGIATKWGIYCITFRKHSIS